MNVPFLDDGAVRRLLGEVDLRPALEETLLAVSRGEVETAPRVGLGGGTLGQVTHLMLARDHRRQRVVTKLVDYDPTRPARLGRPSNVGLVTCMVGPDVIFTASAAEFTAIRTAACTAFALDLLAPPTVEVLTVLGAGPLAEEHVRQFARLRPLRTVHVASRSPARAEAMVDRLRNTFAPVSGAPSTRVSVELCEGIDVACDAADVVIAATSAVDPILFPRHAAAGRVLALIGAGIPARREASGELMADAERIVVETQSAAWHEAGDLLQAEREGLLDRSRTTELVTVLGRSRTTGTPSPDTARPTGARSPVAPQANGYTIYKSVGAAWEDLACAAVLAAALV